MKSNAIAINNFSGTKSTISAFDAFLLREENNKEYKKLALYYKVVNDEYRVFPRFNKSTQRAHFVFYSKNNNLIQSDSDGESFTHYVAKKALANLSTLHLVNKNKNVDLYLNVTKGEDEKTFNFTKFRADVYYEIDKNQPSKESKGYFYKWNEKFVIEVAVTHKTNYNKYKTFEKNGIPIFEVSISDKIRKRFELDKQGLPLTQERKDRAIEQIQNMFEKNIYGKFISNPSSEEFLIMCKYKEEIEQFRVAKQQNYEELEKVCSEIELKEAELQRITSDIEHYNDLENKNNSLSEENKRLIEQNNKLEDENKALRQKLSDFNKHPIKGIMKAIRKK